MALAHRLRFGLCEGGNIDRAEPFGGVQCPRRPRCRIEPCRTSHGGRVAVLGCGSIPVGTIRLREKADALDGTGRHGIPARNSGTVFPRYEYPRGREVIGDEDRGIARIEVRARAASGEQKNGSKKNEGLHNCLGKGDALNIDDLSVSREQSNAVALCF